MFLVFTNHSLPFSFSALNLKAGYQFSLNNGFGPIPQILPTTAVSGCRLTQMSHLLHQLLSTLTPVEEAAIRRICPLLSIVKLAHGNIGVRGNVSCVHQDSKLGTVLPNTPDKCNVIVISRTDKAKSRMTSTRFHKNKILVTLQMLKRPITKLGATSRYPRTI